MDLRETGLSDPTTVDHAGLTITRLSPSLGAQIALRTPRPGRSPANTTFLSAHNKSAAAHAWSGVTFERFAQVRWPSGSRLSQQDL